MGRLNCNCPLNKDKFERTCPKLFGEGSNTPDVIFIGEAPGEDEDKVGRPFIGKAGKVLRHLLKDVEYTYYITNVVKCRPIIISPSNNLINRTPTQNEVYACLPLLVEELCQFKPKLYVLLGRTAIKAILDRNTAISQLRGGLIQTKYAIPCVATYHPAAIVRNPSNTKMLEEFIVDIQSITKYMQNPMLLQRSTTILYYSDTEELYTKLLPKLNLTIPTAIDFEVASSGKLLCVSLTQEDNKAHVIDLSKYENNVFVGILLNSLSHCIFHNAAYDLKEIKKHFNIWLWDTAKIDDTIILHSIISPDQSHSLEDIAFIYRPDVGNYKVNTSKGNMEDYSIRDVMQRCALDTIVTYHIYRELYSKVDSNIYENMLLANKLLIQVMWNGVLIDKEKLMELQTEYRCKTEQLKNSILQKIPVGINIDSSKQVSDLLYNIFLLPKIIEGKVYPSVNTDVLIELERMNINEEYKIILNQLIQYRHLKVVLSNTFKNIQKAIIEDRLYTNYKIFGTRTSRLSSSKPNLQNIVKDIRACFIPQPGNWFLKTDANQMELRWAGIISEDKNLIEIYNTPGMDLHMEMLEKMRATIKKADRVMAKTVNFGMIYLMGATTLARELNIGVNTAYKIIEAHKAKFKGYWRYVRYIERQVQERKPVVTWWGRERVFKETEIRNAVNYPIQSSASDFIVLYMFPRLLAQGYANKIRLTTHDDIIFELNIQEIGPVIQVIEGIVKEFNKKVPIPMKFEYELGNNWKDFEKIPDEAIDNV